jgi:acetyltransferase-like isoleucine patch superfamily enzyme
MTILDDQTLPKTHTAATEDRSPVARYASLIAGRQSLLGLLHYEWCVCLSWVPGALGLLLRRLFWPRLLGSCGKKVYFGTNVTLMHPHRIHLGDRTVVGNGCVLDARTLSSDHAITIAEDVILSHGVMLSCKGGLISIGRRVGIGAFTVVQSTAGSSVDIGDDAMVGAHCYLAGGGEYNMDRLDVPIAQQGLRATGVTRVEEGVWLGARVSVLGGVSVGSDSVVGTGAVVAKPLPAQAVCVGVPARVVRMRAEPVDP